MDWMNVEPDKYNLLRKHYTPGRGGAKIEFVTLHHMAMIGDIDDCVRVWQDRPASAHYAISPTGMIGQAVNDSDTAWSNANLYSNQRSISIEHSNSGGPSEDWPISEATREAGAHLVAALCRYYKLGRPESGKNVRFHSIESGGSTACPYHLRPGHKYHDQYIRRAQYWYDQMTGKTTPKQPAKTTGGSSVTMNAVEQVNAHTRAFISGFFGPQFDAIQEIWTQLRGPAGKGWSQLGQDSQGRNLTPVDALAAIRLQLAQLQADVDELKRRKK
ncbi:N-acetylmuramoyl-L-alanine amidase [Corynebacterium sp. HMSC076G08]|uniref:peptidoglycan recognition protein family protein n=1 Tax=Corynebacterium sp. HMSC076G08 TaxID=1739310 RepID=UPI0008A1D9AB|nr:peptidoglycan recognition family protein [Corynebacterium sp. HMSC076G08]OFK66598.1 N-acetylmuramoyl-L-alanine amidase [Corynebacterium sp. HMSC076G08]